MSHQERTPLLSDVRDLPFIRNPPEAEDSLPIFLCVCYSTWPWPNQKALVVLRGIILSYLVGVGPVIFHYKTEWEFGSDNQTPLNTIFDFSTVSFVLNLLYHLVAFLWSLTHHLYPTLDEDDRRLRTRMLFKLSPPVDATSGRKELLFSLFYTSASLFSFMNTIVYWAVTVPHDRARAFPSNGLQLFAMINLYGVSSLVSSTEILLLNSIKRHGPMPGHIIGTMLLLAGYLGWAALGHSLTGRYPFFWMDPEEMGNSGLVVAYAAGFVAMGPTTFAAMHGLTALREKMAKCAGRRGQQYHVLDSGVEEE